MAYQVTIAPLPSAVLLHVRCGGEAQPCLAAALPAGLAATPNSFETIGDVRTTRIGPDEWLVAAPPTAGTSLRDALERAVLGWHAVILDVSDQYHGFRLGGPECREVLAQGCSLDLRSSRFPVGRSARTLLAEVTVLLSRTGQQGFELLVDRCLGRHLEDWLTYAAGR